MPPFLIPGKDLKYCKIKQGGNTVIFQYSNEKIEPQPILALNVRPGFNAPEGKAIGAAVKAGNMITNAGKAIAGKLPGSIGNAVNTVASKLAGAATAGNETPTPRGSTVMKIGNAGFKIDIDGILTGDYYVQRNKLLQIIDSGQPCHIYLSRFQTIATSGKLSDINPNLRANEGFYCVLQANSSVDERFDNIASCSVRITAHEVKSSDKVKEGSLKDYLNPLLNILEKASTSTDNAKNFIKEMNNHLVQALGILNNFGSEIGDIIGEINNMNNNISDLLKTPSNLSAQYSSIVGSIRSLGNNIGKTFGLSQNDSNNQKNIEGIANGLINYSSTIPMAPVEVIINGKPSINIDGIKQNIIKEKLANFMRYIGFGLLLNLALNKNYLKISEIDQAIEQLKEAYNILSSDIYYNLSPTFEGISINLHEDARDQDVLQLLYQQMHITLNQLRFLKQNLQSQNYITPCDTNIWNIISEKYINFIAAGTDLNQVAQILFYANNLKSYNAIIPKNTTVLLPLL